MERESPNGPRFGLAQIEVLCHVTADVERAIAERCNIVLYGNWK